MASSVHKGQGFQEQVGWGLVPPHFLLRNSFSKAKCPHPHAAVTSMSGQALKVSASDGHRISKPISDESSAPEPDTSWARVSRAEMGTKAYSSSHTGRLDSGQIFPVMDFTQTPILTKSKAKIPLNLIFQNEMQQ